MDSEIIYKLLQENQELWRKLNIQYALIKELFNKLEVAHDQLMQSEEEKYLLDLILVDYEDILQKVLDGEI